MLNLYQQSTKYLKKVHTSVIRHLHPNNSKTLILKIFIKFTTNFVTNKSSKQENTTKMLIQIFLSARSVSHLISQHKGYLAA